jgi:hypothetical protein
MFQSGAFLQYLHLQNSEAEALQISSGTSNEPASPFIRTSLFDHDDEGVLMPFESGAILQYLHYRRRWTNSKSQKRGLGNEPHIPFRLEALLVLTDDRRRFSVFESRVPSTISSSKTDKALPNLSLGTAEPHPFQIPELPCFDQRRGVLVFESGAILSSFTKAMGKGP